ncbi:unnamed protein product, partial [Meganyctiphanes norvegica]
MIHKRVALAVTKRNDGMSTALSEFYSELGLSAIPQRLVKRLGHKKKKVTNSKAANIRRKERIAYAEKRTACLAMKEYDRAIDLETFHQVNVNIDLLDKTVIFYDLETSGLARDSDILQIAGIKYNTLSGREEDVFSNYCLPTKPIPNTASAVNKLYTNVDCTTLSIQTDKGLQEVNASPLRLVLNQFWSWIVHDYEQNPGQRLLVGFNNSSFDDHVLLHHSREKLQIDLLTAVRKTIFTVDLKSIVKGQGSLAEIYSENKCSGNIQFHDALE